MRVESLVAQFRVLFIRLWHSNHLRHGHGINLAESLRRGNVSGCILRPLTKPHRMAGGSTNLPHPSIPSERPTPEQPPLVIMQPPPRVRKLIDTHILEGAIRELAVPLVLDLCDLTRRLVVEDIDLAVDGLLLADALDDVAGTQVHGDWVAAGCDFVVEALDFREGGLEAIPLRFVLLAAYGFGDGVFEDALIVP